MCFNHISICDLKANTLVLNEINQLSECFYCDIIVPLLSNDIHFSDIIFGLCCFMFFIQVLLHDFACLLHIIFTIQVINMGNSLFFRVKTPEIH